MIVSRHNSDNQTPRYKDVALLIDHIRLRSFPDALETFLATQCHFDTILMVTFKKSFKPIMIHPTDPAEHSPALLNYLDHSFILDPLFNSIQLGKLPSVSRLAEFAPDSFESTEYYQTCYQEFDLIDETNLLIELDSEVTCAISLGRKSTLGCITRSELNRLNELFPLIESLIRQFWLSQANEYVKFEQSDQAMKQALTSFGNGVLTKREQQITCLILQGHSSQAIADMLFISLGTVKVHRKNIHSRLNTSNQSEIFTLFLSHLNDLEKNQTSSI